MPGFPPDPAPKPPVRPRRSRARAPGLKTTEFWGKSIVQVVLLLNAVFDLGLSIDDEYALALAGIMETAYAGFRNWAKRGAALESVAEIRAEMRDEIRALVDDAVAAAMRNAPTSTVNVSVQKEPAP